jgi:hypothetical protein
MGGKRLSQALCVVGSKGKQVPAPLSAHQPGDLAAERAVIAGCQGAQLLLRGDGDQIANLDFAYHRYLL